MQFSRRGVLVGAAVGGGLVAAWTLRPRSFSTPLTPGRDEFAFDAWLKIGKDGVVTVAVPQKLNRKQRSALESFAAASDESPRAHLEPKA